ncbi:AAA family ATPase [Streptomyces sp. ISL-96]|uniref:ATP-binding protein n=1 Tax=Streptomyces sp. ISL-96 TaxID=2819191 RepID=UPI0027E2FEA6|nr:AAA family ATPase [Streptomyces sp. ISL-96]
MQLLERADGLEALEGHLGEAVRGRGCLVLLRGEAGVGKTAVVQALAERAPERVRVLIGQCDPLSTPRPLGPLADVATGLGREVEEALAAGAGGPAVFRLLLHAMRQGPGAVLLVFEDVHWARRHLRFAPVYGPADRSDVGDAAGDLPRRRGGAAAPAGRGPR